ncbi:MAG: alanine--tRNA ligase [Nitrospinales bacterium]
MTGSEIRKKFLGYFAGHEHQVVKSASLVPQNDPTLLFTNAGMVQFKNVFLGIENPGYNRAVSAQKCVRAGGKHNDLEMVGRTARHHTFFEMLGNFSFGDYFKKEAIRFGWEFLTDVLRLPREKLYVSVYEDDDEAFGYWRDDIGLGEERIFRMGEKDNFWSMGPTGPCGPCSEIYIDQGEPLGCGKPTCAVGCDCDRYLEIWNLVFMQYNRDEAGKLTPLPRPCIDTGMGLERLTAVAQGRQSNYDSDLLKNVIDEVCRVTGKPYHQDGPTDVSLKVVADHARAAAFLIADGVLPANEGRGYVLRRILRRALRHGKMLGKNEPFLHLVTDQVVTQFKDTYPELEENRSFIDKAVLHEEESFKTTLHFGTQRLDDILGQLRKSKQTVIPGEEIFKLYDTYGFPVDLVEDIAEEAGVTLDMAGFDRAMQAQKQKSVESWKGSGEKAVAPCYKEFLQKAGPTVFHGYCHTQCRGRLLAILKNGGEIETAGEGDEVELLFDETPFYGEAGGQVGDTGKAGNDETQVEILNATRPLPELVAHQAKIVKGSIRKGDALTLTVDAEKRARTVLNHTATHLLQAALKTVLGDHVKQAGSLVAPDRLRFDYTHFSPLTDREKSRLESVVNEKIRENIAVQTREMKIDEALQEGAIALFGEKYGDRVRVVSVPGFSKEFCGGTHVSATGDIGVFKITGEGGIASGVRRIEAVTGPEALEKIQRDAATLTGIRSLLKAQPKEETARLSKILERTRQLEKEVDALKEKLASGKSADLSDEVVTVEGASVLVKKLEGMNPKTLRVFIDNAKNKIKSGIIVAGSAANGKVFLAAGVTEDLTGRFHAGNILKDVAAIVGGRGGGRPDMAQAGGAKPEMLDEALKKVPQIIREKR